MTVPTVVAEASAAHDTPKTINEVVAHSLPELQTLLTQPRAAGEPLTVLLEGAAAEQILGAVAVTVTSEEVSA